MPGWGGEGEGYSEDELLDEGELEEWVEVGEDGAPGFRAALFSSQASQYAAFRPSYPPEIYQRVNDFAAVALGKQTGINPRELAVDVGCGPGNVAKVLAHQYAKVIGVDPSRHQLEHAIQLPNVRYLCLAAEHLATQLPRQSVDLIAVAETLHWLDHRTFYEQARRVLKPTGTLAIWCYNLSQFASAGRHQTSAAVEEANGLMRAFAYGSMGPFWDDRRQYIDRQYAGLEPGQHQFRVCQRQETEMAHVMSMDHFIGFLSSWSPYAAYRATFPNREDPLVDLRAQFKRLLCVEDDAAPALHVVWPVFFLLIRDPVQ